MKKQNRVVRHLLLLFAIDATIGMQACNGNSDSSSASASETSKDREKEEVVDARTAAVPDTATNKNQEHSSEFQQLLRTLNKKVVFEHNQVDIHDSQKGHLDSLVLALNKIPEATIQIKAHGDSTGSDEIDAHLAEARQQNVKDYLIQQGVQNPDRLLTRGYGESPSHTTSQMNSTVTFEHNIPDGHAVSDPLRYTKIEGGYLGYHVRDSMKVGEATTVSLLISKKIPIKLLSKILKESVTFKNHPDTSRIFMDTIRISEKMTANFFAVDDSAISITPKSRFEQEINFEDSTYTRWDWSVRPLKQGRHNLKMVVSVRNYDPAKEDWRGIEVYDGEVAVTAVPSPNNLLDRFSAYMRDNWGWITGALGMGGTIFIWLYNNFLKRKEAEPKPHKIHPKRKNV